MVVDLSLPESRVRALVHAVAELHQIPRFHDARTAFLNSAADLLGADAATLCVLPIRPQSAQRRKPGARVGYDTAELQSFYEDTVAGRLVDPAVAALIRRGQGMGRRRDLVDDATWYAAEAVERRLALQLDDELLGLWPLPSGRGLAIAYHRRASRPDFSSEDLALARVLHIESAWLFRDLDTAQSTALFDTLSPRERETLQLLASGRSEKEAASDLGVSQSTLHTYVKRLYRRLGVRSRPELLALAFTRG